MKKLLFGLVFGLVLFGTAQVGHALTMEDYFTALKIRGLTDESHRNVYSQTIWNNWSKSMQFTAAELNTDPIYSLENIWAGTPISLMGADPSFSLNGNRKAFYVTGHGVNGASVLGTRFNTLDQLTNTQVKDLYDGVYKPFFKILKDSGAVNSGVSTSRLRDIFNSELVYVKYLYISPTGFEQAINANKFDAQTQLSWVTNLTIGASDVDFFLVNKTQNLTCPIPLSSTNYFTLPRTVNCDGLTHTVNNSDNYTFLVKTKQQYWTVTGTQQVSDETKTLKFSFAPAKGASSGTTGISIDTYPASEAGAQSRLSTFDTISDAFKIMFKKSSDPKCIVGAAVNANGTVSSNTTYANYNININQISASLISSSGQKTVLPTISTYFGLATYNSGECGVGSNNGAHGVFVSSTPAKQLPEGLYTFELCVEGVCKQVPNIRLKNSTPSNFRVAYYPYINSVVEYDLSNPSTKVNFTFPNTIWPYVSGFYPSVPHNTDTFQNVYIGAEGKYSKLFSKMLWAYGPGKLSSIWVDDTPSYKEVRIDTPIGGAGIPNSVPDDITSYLKQYKDGTYTIVACAFNDNAVATVNNVSTFFANNKGTLCAPKTLIIKNSPGTKLPGWDNQGLPPGVSIQTTSAVLNVTKPDSGTVTSVSAGISCGTDCAETYIKASSTPVTLMASSSAGYTFTGWTGCTPDASIPSKCSVVMNGDKTVTANFEATTYTLTVLKTGSGSGTINVGNPFLAGSTASTRAYPSSTSTVTGWTGCTSVAGDTCYVFMDGDKTVTVNFGVKTLPVATRYTLTTSTTGTGTGTITTAAATSSYAIGATAILTAVAGANSTFVGWTGCTPDASIPSKCSVVMTYSKPVSANFALINTVTTNLVATTTSSQNQNTIKQSVLTVTKTGSGTVTSPIGISCGTDCSEVYGAPGTVTLTASPSAGYTFNGWTGGGLTGGVCTGLSTSCSLVMNEDKTVTANFKQNSASNNNTTTTNTSNTTSNSNVSTSSSSVTTSNLNSGTASSTTSIIKTCYIKVLSGRKFNWKEVSCASSDYRRMPSSLKKMTSVTVTSSLPNQTATIGSSSTSNQSASAIDAITNQGSAKNNTQPAKLNPFANVWNAITGLFR